MGLFFAAYCAAGAGLLSHYRLSYSQALSPGKKNEELALYLVNLIFLMVPEKPKQKPRGFGKVFTIVLLVFHIYFSWWIYKKKLVADRKKPVIVEQVTYLVSHAVTMGFLDSKVFQNVKAAIDGKQTLTFSTPIGFTKNLSRRRHHPSGKCGLQQPLPGPPRQHTLALPLLRVLSESSGLPLLISWWQSSPVDDSGVQLR